MTAQVEQLKKENNHKKVASRSPMGEGEKQTVKLNYLRMAPRKVRAVADLVKGLSVNEAEAQLMMQPRRAAKPLLKLLRSAVSAAKAKGKMDMSKLALESFRVDGGPMLKRYMPRAQGSMSEIQKKMSHVTLTLYENPKSKNARFSIVVQKKVKHLEHEGGGKKPKLKEKESERAPKERKQGMFKRVFGRNTGNRGMSNKTGGE
jgi:large subunit ribosomal protein L22